MQNHLLCLLPTHMHYATEEKNKEKKRKIDHGPDVGQNRHVFAFTFWNLPCKVATPAQGISHITLPNLLLLHLNSATLCLSLPKIFHHQHHVPICPPISLHQWQPQQRVVHLSACSHECDISATPGGISFQVGTKPRLKVELNRFWGLKVKVTVTSRLPHSLWARIINYIWREFNYVWNKCLLGLQDKLIRICWSKVKFTLA